MQNNNNPSPPSLLDELKSISTFSGRQSTLETNYSKSNWNNATSYIDTIYGGDNINEIAAYNQNAWQAYRNSIGQLVTGTAAEIVKTPAYIQALWNGFDNLEDNAFYRLGETVADYGKSVAPVYVSESSRNKVFAPGDSEYMADFIVNLGPTLALMFAGGGAGSLIGRAAISGLANVSKTARLANLVSKSGKYSRAVKQLDEIKRLNPEMFNKLMPVANTLLTTSKAAGAAVISRMAEAGMEGMETYKKVEEELKRQGKSEEEIKKLANAAAYDVYGKNVLLTAVDFMQFSSLFKALPSIGGKLGSYAGQIVSEGLEEGAQFTFSEQAVKKILEGKDDGFFKTFVDNLDNPEMQKVMVAGGMGGAVFQGVGSLFLKKQRAMQDHYNRIKSTNAENATIETAMELADNEPENLQNAIETYEKEATENQDPKAQEAVDTVKRTTEVYNNIKNNSEQPALEAELNNIKEDSTSERTKEVVQKELDVVKAKNKAKTKLQVLSGKAASKLSSLNDIIKDVNSELTDTKEATFKLFNSILKSVKKLKTNKEFTKEDKKELENEYKTKIDELEYEGKRTRVTSREDEIENAAKDFVNTAANLKAATKNFEDLSTEKGKDEAVKEAEKERKAKELIEDEAKAAKVKTPADLDQINNAAIRNKTRQNKVNEELGDEGFINIAESTPEAIRKFYKDKPFASSLTFEKPIDEVTDQELTNEINKRRERIMNSDKTFKPDDTVPEVDNSVNNTETVFDEPNPVSAYTPYIKQFKFLGNGKVRILNGNVNGKVNHTVEGLKKAGFKLPRKLKNNTVYDLKDSNGNLVKSDFAEKMGLDIDYIESGNVKAGDDVYFQVELGIPNIRNWNELDTTTADDFYVQLVHEDQNGILHVIGVLPSAQKSKSKFIKTLREQLYEEYNAALENSTGISTNIVLETSTKIKEVWGGRPRNISSTKDRRNTIETVMKTGDTPVLGIGNVKDGVATMITNTNERVSLNEYPDNDSIKGGLFLILKDIAGVNRAVRIFSKTISKVEEVRNKLLKQIAILNQEGARSFVRQYVPGEDGFFKLIPDFNEGLVNAYGKSKLSNLENRQIKGLIFIIPANQQAYLEGIEKQGKKWLDDNPDSYSIYRIDNSTKEAVDGKFQVTSLNSNFDEKGTVSLTKEQLEGRIKEGAFLHYAYNYYLVNELNTKPIHIDKTEINRGNYNEQVSKYIETDIEPKNYFHSPEFILETKIVKNETIEKIKKDKEQEVPVRVPEETVQTQPKKDNLTRGDYKIIKDGGRKEESATIEDIQLYSNLIDKMISQGKTAEEIAVSLNRRGFTPRSTKTDFIGIIQAVIDKRYDSFHSFYTSKTENNTKPDISKVVEKPKETGDFFDELLGEFPDDGRFSKASKVNTFVIPSPFFGQRNRRQLESLIGTKLQEGDIITTSYYDGRNQGRRTYVNFKVVNGKLESLNGSTTSIENDKRRFDDITVKRKPGTIDLVATIDWFKKNAPQIPVEVVKANHKIFANGGLMAQGVAHSLGITVSDTASEGTAYHEAFHILFQLILSEKQRASMLKEAKKRFGDISPELLTDIKNTYEGLTDEQAEAYALEEMLADSFKEYVASQEAPQSLGSRIAAFFKRLFDFITESITHKKSIDSFFYNINNAKYSNIPLDIPSYNPRYSKILPNFSIVEKQNAVELLTSLLFDGIDGYAKENGFSLNEKTLYKELMEEGGKDIFINIKNKNSVVYLLMKHFADIRKENPEQAVALQEDYRKLINSLRDEDGNPSNVFGEVLRNLKRYGISIINNDVIQKTKSFAIEDEQLDEQELDETVAEGWQFQAGDINLWANTSIELRLITNTIPIVKWNDAKDNVVFEEGYLSFNKLYAPLEAYKKIQKALGSSVSFNQMKEKFDKLAQSDPFFFFLRNEVAINNEFFLSDVWLHISQSNKPKYLDIIQSKQSIIVTDANSKNNVNVLLAQYISNIKSVSSLIDNGQFNIEKAKDIRTQLDKLYSEPTLNTAAIIDIYNDIGFPVEDNYSNDVLTSLYADNTIKGFLTQIINGNDPLGLIDEDQSKQKGTGKIRAIVKIIDTNTQEVAADSHQKPSGGTVHEWIQPNFLSKTLNRFKDAVHGKFYIESVYYNDSYFRYSPLLQTIMRSYEQGRNFHKNLNMAIINSARFKGMNKGVEYSKMSPFELIKLNLSLFHNNGNKSFFIPTPVNSDSPANTAVEISDTKSAETNFEKLINLVLQEIERVSKQDAVDIKTRNKNKSKFINFTFLEDKKDKVLEEWNKVKNADISERQKLQEEFIERYIRKDLRKLLSNEIKEFNRKLSGLNIIDNEGKFTDEFLNGVVVSDFITNYVTAHMVYSLDLGNILNGDISYYKGSGDYYKRAKQVWSPGKYLATDKIRKFFSIKILPDNKILDTNFMDKVEAILGKEMADKYRFEETDDNDNPLGVNETDAQTFIDLYRFREIQIGLNRWTDSLQIAYDSLIQGNFNLEDVREIFNVIKPFYYSIHTNGSTTHPMQVKNSEQVILPFYGLKTIKGQPNALYNPEYKKMLEEMGYEFDGETVSFPFNDQNTRNPETHPDAFVFESAVKVGLHEPSSLGNYKAGKLHQLNNADYRLQMETPAHHIDFKGLLGTQVRKHTLNNLDLEGTYTVDGKEMTGAELRDLYNEVIVRDIQESINELEKEFNTDENGTAFQKLIAKLRTEVINRDLDNEYMEALDYLDNTYSETVLPLYHPLHSKRIEALLTAIITNNVVKQKITNSVVLANHTSYGFDKRPKIVFDGDRIKHVEVYAPMYSKDLEKYINPETGLIDIDKVPEKMLEGIVYRIPNEDKYSTFPVKIIGFLPYEQGGSIIMPPEVTKIAGLDFDIDKVYGFFHNAKSTRKLNAIRKYLAKKHPEHRELLLKDENYYSAYDNFMDAIRSDSINNEEYEIIRNLFDELTPQELATFTEHKVVSSMDTKRGRDNLKIDIMKAVWTNSHTTKQFLSPGNFDRLKDLAEKINEARGIDTGNLQIWSPLTWIEVANRMLTGKALIGIAANAAAGYAVLQHADELTLDGKFLFNGESYDTLNTQSMQIAKNLAEYVAAFVDNGKDPVAGSVNVNGYTIDVAVAMLLAGVDFETVHYFLSQEKLIEFVDAYLNMGGNFQAEQKVKEEYGLLKFNAKDHRPSPHNLKSLKARDNNVIKDFLYYKYLSKPVAELVQAIKQGEVGVGPTLADAVSRLEQINSDEIDRITGARDFLDNESLMQSKINSVLNYGLEFIINKANMIDIRAGIYNEVRSYLTEYKNGMRLTVKEINTINSTIFDYLVSGYIKPNRKLIVDTPKQLENYKKENPDNDYKSFLNRLYITKDGIINYSGLGGMDNLELGRIRETWSKMLHDPATQELAENLVAYSYYKGGFRVGPSSFSSLQPVHFYRINKELNDFIREQLGKDMHDYRPFVEQFIRHNFRTLGYIPKVEVKTEGVKILLEEEQPYKIIVTNKATNVHKSTNVEPLQYIKYGEASSEQLLFEYDHNKSNEDFAIYKPVQPLGVYLKGLQLEEYNYNAQDQKSIFKNDVSQSLELYNNSKKNIVKPITSLTENIVPKLKIPMNFSDGTGGRKMKEEFKGKSTMDLILSGDRTATSRDFTKNYNRQKLEEGDIIQFYNKSGDTALVKVTKSYYKVSDISPEEWSNLEGWDTSVYDKLDKNKYVQFQFELIQNNKSNLDEQC